MRSHVHVVATVVATLAATLAVADDARACSCVGTRWVSLVLPLDGAQGVPLDALVWLAKGDRAHPSDVWIDGEIVEHTREIPLGSGGAVLGFRPAEGFRPQRSYVIEWERSVLAWDEEPARATFTTGDAASGPVAMGGVTASAACDCEDNDSAACGDSRYCHVTATTPSGHFVLVDGLGVGGFQNLLGTADGAHHEGWLGSGMCLTTTWAPRCGSIAQMRAVAFDLAGREVGAKTLTAPVTSGCHGGDARGPASLLAALLVAAALLWRRREGPAA